MIQGEGQRRYRNLPDGRRKLVCVENGIDGYHETETSLCSGCTEYGDYGTTYGPSGCEECGYTGKRRHKYWIPFDINKYPREAAKRLNRALSRNKIDH